MRHGSISGVQVTLFFLAKYEGFDTLRAHLMKNLSPRALEIPIVGLLCAILLAGCGSKISEENFERIHSGMTQAEVRAILGEPTESASMGLGPLVGATATWRGKGGTITIQFVNEKVVAKQFVKPTL